MLRSSIAALCIFGWLQVGSAQGDTLTAKTNDGRTVILSDDGTWVYAEEARAKKPANPTAAQTCAEVVKVDTDKMTGESSRQVRPMYVSEDGQAGFVLGLIEALQTIIWSIDVVGAGACIDDDDKMNILFVDGTRLELKNDAKFNCDGSFVAYFGGGFGKRSQLLQLTTNQVATIRLWTRGDYLQLDLPPKQRAALQRAFQCIHAEPAEEVGTDPSEGKTSGKATGKTERKPINFEIGDDPFEEE